MEPKSTRNMVAECVTRDKKGHVTASWEIAIPEGITHDEAVTFVRKYTTHEIAGFLTYQFA